MPDQPIRTRDQICAFDRYCIDDLGVPGIVLMENAGRQIAEVVREDVGLEPMPHVVVLAGRGNNGGDGFVVARHLAMYGVAAKVLLIGPRDQVAGDAGTNLRILEAMDADLEILDAPDDAVLARVRQVLEVADVIVDGLLGTGAEGAVREPLAGIIRAVNDARDHADVFAIDIPSGLDADTGRPLGDAVMAKATVTMAAIKKGFAAESAEAYTGRVVLADIGVPMP
ncbi:MAG: NAD(P)H-hydrate epimerase [Planctomycetes bacterium]|nr:NAD(P)H-hydrate epimerase [Planctomycetota bacterium]